MKRYIILLFLLFSISGTILSQSTRKQICMNDSSWTFIKKDVPNSQLINFDNSSWQKVSIPHDWNGGIDGVNNDVFKGEKMYLGPGSYRSIFSIGENLKGKKITIEFEAVSLAAEVWINEHYLGRHKGGYTAFSFDITNYLNYSAKNTLVVKATNANDSTIAPWMAVPFGVFPNSSDYAVYGGIYRDVWLIATDSVFVKKHHHIASNISASEATIKLATTITNSGKTNASISLRTDIIDMQNNVVKSLENVQNIKAGESFEYNQLTSISNPNLWSPSYPYLYKVISTVKNNGVDVDQVENSLGIRSYILKNNTGFSINGEKMLLRGTNRHQDIEGFGYALSNEQHQNDVKLLKKVGINFLRHAHYPADRAIVEACDKLGMMLWLEIPVSTCVAGNDAFKENAKSQLTEMIEQFYNHPSVILWGLGNESDRDGGSGKEAPASFTNTMFKELNKLAHSIDSTRPTTGCNWMFENNQQIVDIYAPQDWTGWYSGNYTEYKPTQLIGEYGSDIGVNIHIENYKKFDFSQEYACEYHEYKSSVGEARKDSFPGHLTWISFDFASPRKDRGTNFIPYMNMKGMFKHDHKTPKDIAYFYQSQYTLGTKAPMVYIVSKSWKNRVPAKIKKNYWVYSNCDSVILYNGYKENPLGFRIKNAGPRKDTRFQWNDITIQNPFLYAEGYVNGNVVAKDTLVFENFKNIVPEIKINTEKWNDSVYYPHKANLCVKSNCDSVLLKNGYSSNSFGIKTQKDANNCFNYTGIQIKSKILYAEGYISGTLVISDTLLLEPWSNSIPSAIEEVEYGNTAVHSIYPNPVTGELNIKLNLLKQTEVTIEIYNTTGQLIDSVVNRKILSKGEYLYKWNSAQSKGGMYVCNITYNNQTSFEKVVNIK